MAWMPSGSAPGARLPGPQLSVGESFGPPRKLRTDRHLISFLISIQCLSGSTEWERGHTPGEDGHRAGGGVRRGGYRERRVRRSRKLSKGMRGRGSSKLRLGSLCSCSFCTQGKGGPWSSLQATQSDGRDSLNCSCHSHASSSLP